jgi:NAD dependent epimerase/dehydratase family enzyme
VLRSSSPNSTRNRSTTRASRLLADSVNEADAVMNSAGASIAVRIW